VLGYIELILTKQLADALEWLRNSINNVAVLKVFFEACFPVTSDGEAGIPKFAQILPMGNACIYAQCYYTACLIWTKDGSICVILSKALP